jgi:hypothetical protein
VLKAREGVVRDEAPWVSPTVVLSLLESVEALEPEATGSFTLGEGRQPTVVVFVQRGRICWAVCASMRGRMTDHLLASGEHACSRAQVEEVYAQCRRGGLPLGEALVARGLVSEAGVRDALFRHTCEALLHSHVERSRRWRWHAHSEQSYAASYTFSAAEVLVGLTSLQRGESLRAARFGLDRHVPPDCSAVAFVRDAGGLPLVVRDVELTVSELVELASHVDVADAFSPRAVVLSRTRAGHGVVAWQQGEILFAVVCPSAGDLNFALATHRREPRSGRT